MKEYKDRSKELKKPDNSILKEIPFPSDKAVQPGWIGEKFPHYVGDHAMHHELISVRTTEHKGHQIKITTTYEIEIDGRIVHFHVQVGDDGRLHCHSTPYSNYDSALDLVKSIVDRFPQTFTGESKEEEV